MDINFLFLRVLFIAEQIMKEMNVNGKLSYQLYNFKNLKNTHGGVLLLVKVQGESTNGTKLRKTSQFDFKAAALN